jgi:hypothetical protein
MPSNRRSMRIFKTTGSALAIGAGIERVVRYLCRRYAARLIYRIGTVG